MEFHGTIQHDGKTATGVRVPDEVVSALGGGNRPRVRVTLAGYSYQSSIARMGGEFKVPVSAAVREESGLAAGEEVVVHIELDDAPREPTLPAELADALERDPAARQVFDRLSYSNRKRHALAVESAKTAETRERRIDRVLAELHAADT